MLKSTGTKRLKLQFDIPLSNFAFKLKLRRYSMALILLDIASHWLQMYSQLLTNKTSHKVPPRRYCSSRHRHAF